MNMNLKTRLDDRCNGVAVVTVGVLAVCCAVLTALGHPQAADEIAVAAFEPAAQTVAAATTQTEARTER